MSTLPEEAARYIAAKLGMTFEENVFYAYMPETPLRAVCVYCEETRQRTDEKGTTIQVLIRSDADGDWPMTVAETIDNALLGAKYTRFTPTGRAIQRIKQTQGFHFEGLTTEGMQSLSAKYTIWEVPD